MIGIFLGFLVMWLSHDIGITRTLTPEQRKTLSSRVLYCDPMMAVFPASRQIKTKCVRISDLANESFVLFHREGAPPLFDTITRLCNKVPEGRVRGQWHADGTHELGSGAGRLYRTSVRQNLRSEGVRFYLLQPDDVRVELVAA